MLDLSVIVPARNAEDMLGDCLAAIAASDPREIIVVDGRSTDSTVEIARSFGATVLDDEGRGLPAARHMGAQAASSDYVALIDADVVVGDGDLARLLDEHRRDGYTALQAGLHSVSGEGYWGQALAQHHRSGRSKDWFGVVATIFERDALLEHSFDARFLSGEDIDLRWRLRQAGAKIGVSRETVVEHRFGDTWEFAKGQWLADGKGFGRMVVAHGLRAKLLLGVPLAAGLRGALLSLARLQPRWLPYYACFVLFNYAGLASALGERRHRRSPAREGEDDAGRLVQPEWQALAPRSQISNGLTLIAAKAITMGLGFAFWVLAARLFAPREVGLAAGVVAAMMLCTQFAQFGFGSAFITHFPELRQGPRALLDTSFTLVAALGAVAGLVFVLLAAVVLAQLDVVAREPLFALLFVSATVFGTVGILFDQVATAIRRGEQALVRNVAFGAGTLLLLALVGVSGTSRDAQAIFTPWAVAGLIAFVLGIRQLRRAMPAYRPHARVDRQLAGRLGRSGLPNYVLTLAERSPGLVLPVIVAEVLSPGANATWYTIWMLAWVAYIVPIQVGMTIFSEVSHDRRVLRKAVRRGIACSLAVGAGAALVLTAAAPLILSALGSHYVDGGTGPLRVLLIAVVPMTFIQAYFSTCRARRRLGEAIAIGWVTAIASVAMATAAGIASGLMGMALAWLIVQSLAGVWSLVRLHAIQAETEIVSERRELAPFPPEPGLESARS